jgi:hypothetical protein
MRPASELALGEPRVVKDRAARLPAPVSPLTPVTSPEDVLQFLPAAAPARTRPGWINFGTPIAEAAPPVTGQAAPIAETAPVAPVAQEPATPATAAVDQGKRLVIVGLVLAALSLLYFASSR